MKHPGPSLEGFSGSRAISARTFEKGSKKCSFERQVWSSSCSQDAPRRRQDSAKWPKLAPSGRQDGPKVPILELKLTDLAPFWESSRDLFTILGAILQKKKAKTKKNDDSRALFKVFWGPGVVLGGYVGSSWRYVGLRCAIWALSWSNLATRWRPRAPR